MNDKFWRNCCEDVDYISYLEELIYYEMIEEGTAECSITKMIIDGRVNELLQAQWNTFVCNVAEEFYVDGCERCDNAIPWCEMIVALNNGRVCNYCQHMMEKDD